MAASRKTLLLLVLLVVYLILKVPYIVLVKELTVVILYVKGYFQTLNK
jgi:hypothetical protein